MAGVVVDMKMKLQHPPSYASLVAYQETTVHVETPCIWPRFDHLTVMMYLFCSFCKNIFTFCSF